MVTQETFIMADALMGTFQARLDQTCPELGGRSEISRREANLEVQHVLGALAYAAAEQRTASTMITNLPAMRNSYQPGLEIMAHAS